MKRHLLFILASLAAGSLSAQDLPMEEPKQQEPPAVQERQFNTVSEAEKAADDDDVICSYQSVTGSRFKKRVCGTKADWEHARDTARKEIMRGQRGATLPPGQ